MADNISLIEDLQRLGLTPDEAALYIELLKGPASHLQLSRQTGITRSKVYRVASGLKQRGLAADLVDGTGRYLVVTNPENLEAELAAEEERLHERRKTLDELVPGLVRLQQGHANGRLVIRTYDGSVGFRHMLWHELKTSGELLLLGGAAIEELAPNPRWAERHRASTVAAGYHLRELTNTPYHNFTRAAGFGPLYQQRIVPAATLLLPNQTAIYNNTVATYYRHKDKKIGIEIISASYAEMHRQIFEQYWRIAQAAA